MRRHSTKGKQSIIVLSRYRSVKAGRLFGTNLCTFQAPIVAQPIACGKSGLILECEPRCKNRVATVSLSHPVFRTFERTNVREWFGTVADEIGDFICAVRIKPKNGKATEQRYKPTLSATSPINPGFPPPATPFGTFSARKRYALRRSVRQIMALHDTSEARPKQKHHPTLRLFQGTTRTKPLPKNLTPKILSEIIFVPFIADCNRLGLCQYSPVVT